MQATCSSASSNALDREFTDHRPANVLEIFSDC